MQVQPGYFVACKSPGRILYNAATTLLHRIEELRSLGKSLGGPQKNLVIPKILARYFAEVLLGFAAMR